jgi:hypothetical protein
MLRRHISERQRIAHQREGGRRRSHRYRKRQSNPKSTIAAVIKGRGKPPTDPIRSYGPLLKDSTILKVAARMKIQQPDKTFGRAWIKFMSTVIARAIENLADGI